MGAPFELQIFRPTLKSGEHYAFPTEEEYRAMYKSETILSCAKLTNNHYNLVFGGLAGMWTDDSCQMMCLTEVIHKYKKVVGSQLDWAIDDWWNCGYCTPLSNK